MLKAVFSLLVASSLQAEDIAVDRVEFYSALWSAAERQCPTEAAALDRTVNGYVNTVTGERAAGGFYDFDGFVYAHVWPLTADQEHITMFVAMLQGLPGQFVWTLSYVEAARDTGVLTEDYYENLEKLDVWVTAVECMMPTTVHVESLPNEADIEEMNQMLSMLDCGIPFNRMRQITSLGREGIIPEPQFVTLTEDIWTSCEDTQ